MRGPTEYQMYLFRLEKYYQDNKIAMPKWIDIASDYYGKLYYLKHSLSMMCSNSAIPRKTMEYLANIDREYDSLEYLPEELYECVMNSKIILKNMYNELMSDKNTYFINEWTLTKCGRKKMREYVDELPAVGKIMPPGN